jgi:hypothetical protein
VSLYCFRQDERAGQHCGKCSIRLDGLAAEIGRATGGVLFSKKKGPLITQRPGGTRKIAFAL